MNFSVSPPFSAEATALRQTLRQRILTVTEPQFEPLALAVFRYQAAYNPVYRQYLGHLNVRPDNVVKLTQIPFMPIGFFRHHAVQTGALPTTLTFASSGTTGAATSGVPATAARPSHHYVADVALYDAVSRRIFEQVYGPLAGVHVLALLPSYLERNNSSLVYMVQRFMVHAGSDQSGFFLHDLDALTARLRYLLTEQGDGRKTLLIGVTFALLDWAERSGQSLGFLRNNPNVVIMETGGMKGRRRELLREEVHQMLTDRLGVPVIHSEYGMTELLSQAYSVGHGLFRESATLRILLRDPNDPFHLHPPLRSDQRSEAQSGLTGSRLTGERRTGSRLTGGINVVDLANLDSCAFVETQDLGQYGAEPGTFRVVGRFDNSDLRGCNLLVV